MKHEQRLSLDELKVAVAAARAYPQGGTLWVEKGNSCCADAISIFRGDDGNRFSCMQYIADVYYFAARWSRSNTAEVESRGQIFIGALQANPDWVADVLQSIVDAAEGRNIERAVTSVPVGMAIDGTVVYAEGGAR